MSPPSIPTVKLDGHLTKESLDRALRGLELPDRAGPILVDCRTMTGYDLAARHAFVDWNREHSAQVSRVAIITDNRVWWMVISAMSLASGRAMKGFATEREAAAWAQEQTPTLIDRGVSDPITINDVVVREGDRSKPLRSFLRVIVSELMRDLHKILPALLSRPERFDKSAKVDVAHQEALYG